MNWKVQEGKDTVCFAHRVRQGPAAVTPSRMQSPLLDAVWDREYLMAEEDQLTQCNPSGVRSPGFKS